jgi:hypothetical protein
VGTTAKLLANQSRNKILLVAYSFTFVVLAIAILRFTAHHTFGQDISPPSWTTNVWLPLLVTGILGSVLSAKHHVVAATCTLQVGMLLATWSLSGGLTWMDSRLSARGVLAASHMGVRFLPSRDVFAYDVPRGIHYGLNFYLRREIPELSSGTQGLVFSSWRGRSALQTRGYVCEQYLVVPAAVLCRWPGD